MTIKQEYISLLRWMNTSEASEAIALESGSRHLSYRSLVSNIEKTACWLSDIESGVVGIVADNSFEWIYLDLAAQALGVIFVPLPSFFSRRQISHAVQEAGIEYLVVQDEYVDLVRPVSDQTSVRNQSYIYDGYQVHKYQKKMVSYPAGTSKLTYTSGSTGDPKGVCLSLDNQMAVAESLNETIDKGASRHLSILPFATLLENIAGIYVTLLRGGTVCIPTSDEAPLSGSSKLSVAALSTSIERYSPNSMITLPEIASVLLMLTETAWKPPESLMFIAVGGATVSPNLIERAQSTGLPLFQGYGLSECASVVALNTKQGVYKGVGNVLPHLVVSIADDGEVLVSGNTFLGYLGDLGTWHATKVKTGDLGGFNDQSLQIRGRKKNLIVTSYGRNINPEWVESEIGASLPGLRAYVGGHDRPHLFLLATLPASVSEQAFQLGIESLNKSLPDYARIGAYQTLKESEWADCFTANNRPKRAVIENQLKSVINEIYQ